MDKFKIQFTQIVTRKYEVDWQAKDIKSARRELERSLENDDYHVINHSYEIEYNCETTVNGDK